MACPVCEKSCYILRTPLEQNLVISFDILFHSLYREVIFVRTAGSTIN